MREALVIRPKVAPHPDAREALEARQAAVVPPPGKVLIRDEVLTREQSLPTFRQAG